MLQAKLEKNINAPSLLLDRRTLWRLTETLKFVRALIKKPMQYIHISQKDYFKKTQRGEGTGIERLQVIHNETKGKVALIGLGDWKVQKK